MNDNPSAITFDFRIGDDEYVVRSGRLTGTMSQALTTHLGVGFTGMLNKVMQGELETQYVAALIYLARVQRGEANLQLSRVLDEVTFDDLTRFVAVKTEPGTVEDGPGEEHPLL